MTYKKIKKVFFLLLLVSFFVTLTGIFAKADGNSTGNFRKYLEERERVYSSLKGEPLAKVKTKDGVISSTYGVTGKYLAIPNEYNGEKSEFIAEDFDFSKNIEHLELPDTTVAILSSENSKLNQIGAFYSNKNLKKVIPSRNLRYIGDKAFYGAKSLEYFFFPYLTRHIGDYSFAYCENLPAISIYGDTSIGNGAFAGCKNLTDVYLSERVTRVGLDAFVHTSFYDSLTDEYGICGDILIKYNGNGGDIVIPDGVRVIADGVFAGRLSITSVTFPESVQYIGNSTFRSCENLERVFFVSDNINLTIGKNAFDGCSLSKDVLSVIKLLPVDEKNIIITEESREIIKKPPFSIISFLANYKPLSITPIINLPLSSTQKYKLPEEKFSIFNKEKRPQITSKNYLPSSSNSNKIRIPYKQKSGVSLP